MGDHMNENLKLEHIQHFWPHLLLTFTLPLFKFGSSHDVVYLVVWTLIPTSKVEYFILSHTTSHSRFETGER